MKDRYSVVLPLFGAGMGLIFLGFSLMAGIGVKRGWLMIGIGLLCCFPAVLVGISPARFHFYIEGMYVKDQGGAFYRVEPNNPPYKGEGICIKKDGVRKRFKAVSGTDFRLSDGEIVPCGWGSRLMQQIGCGGWEMPSIQDKPKWKCP